MISLTKKLNYNQKQTIYNLKEKKVDTNFVFTEMSFRKNCNEIFFWKYKGKFIGRKSFKIKITDEMSESDVYVKL